MRSSAVLIRDVTSWFINDGGSRKSFICLPLCITFVHPFPSELWPSLTHRRCVKAVVKMTQ